MWHYDPMLQFRMTLPDMPEVKVGAIKCGNLFFFGNVICVMSDESSTLGRTAVVICAIDERVWSFKDQKLTNGAIFKLNNDQLVNPIDADFFCGEQFIHRNYDII